MTRAVTGLGRERWLVTGGAGFIGFHVPRELLARGIEVVILDDFRDAPYPREEKRRNVRDLETLGAPLRVVEGCITDEVAVRGAMEGAARVVHLAGLAGVRPSFLAPARYARVNVEGTAVVLEAARTLGVERVVFASSSSVYGNSTPLPAHEDAACVVPESPYAASKRGAELVASALLKQAPSLRCAALRFFTVYGPRQRPEMAITLFARAALAGRAVPRFGDGSMRRDFTHVSDIVRGILAASDLAPPGFRTYNLGSGRPVSLTELVTALEQATGKPLAIEALPPQLGDVEATFADISRAGAELDWEPRVALDEGLRTVVEWVGQDRSEGRWRHPSR